MFSICNSLNVWRRRHTSKSSCVALSLFTKNETRSINQKKLLLLEEQIKEELGELLGREIYSAGSQLLGLLMFDSDIDVAIAVEDENDLKHVLSILESQNFDFEAYTNNIYHGLQFGVCCSVMEGVKIDIQLRSKKNIADLETQIVNLPNWDEEEISRLRKKKYLHEPSVVQFTSIGSMICTGYICQR